MAALDAAPADTAAPHPATALLDATTELLTQEPPSAVAGRRIAAAAGVNYAQIHRHFGSKRELCRQVLDRLGDAYLDDAFPPGALVPTPGVVVRHESFVRVLANIQLDEAALTLRPQNPVVQRYSGGLLILRPELDATARATLVALSCSMQLGVCIHRTSLTRSATLDDHADLVDRELVTTIERLHAGRGPFAGSAIAPRPVRTRGSRPASLSAERGRAEVEARLVAAGVELLADRTPAAISGRQLAARAGVNYGLIHHYFGSTAEVLEHASRQIRDEFYAAESGPDSMPDFFSMRVHPGYVRALTRVALDAKLALADDHFPVVSALLARHRMRHGEPGPSERCRYLIVAATQLAWSLFEPLLGAALGRRLEDLEQYAASVLAKLLNFEKYPSS